MCGTTGSLLLDGVLSGVFTATPISPSLRFVCDAPVLLSQGEPLCQEALPLGKLDSAFSHALGQTRPSTFRWFLASKGAVSNKTSTSLRTVDGCQWGFAA